jgi:hypothetical protein
VTTEVAQGMAAALMGCMLALMGWYLLQYWTGEL